MSQHILRIMKDVRTRLSPVGFVIVLYVLLVPGLLLGDGKQGVIDVYTISVSVLCWFAYSSVHTGFRQLPRALLLPWIAVLCSLLFSSAVSDSVGLSLSWIVRLIGAYVIYRMCYSAASPRTSRYFVVGVIGFVGFAVALSVIVSLAPALKEFLPSMNLVSLRWGHNHLADLLVFVAPAIFYFLFQSAPPPPFMIRMGGFGLYIMVLLSTFARGALFIVAAFAAMFFFRLFRVGRTTTKVHAVWFAVGLLVALAVLFVALRGSMAYRQMVRPLTLSNRLEYWRQAVSAFYERPLLGSGPGTFSLLSGRYRVASQDTTWFAHSIVLEMGAEMGLVGLLAWIWLFGAHGARSFERGAIKDPYSRSLLLGVALLFVYSLFEYVLNYQIVWMLFWGAVGCVVGVIDRHNKSISLFAPSVAVPLAVVGAFYVLWSVSSVALLVFHRTDIAYYVAPFDTTTALMYAEKPRGGKLAPVDLVLVELMHRRSPEVLYAIAQTLAKSHDARAREYYIRAVELDPLEEKYVESLVRYLVSSRSAVLPTLERISSLYLPKGSYPLPSSLQDVGNDDLTDVFVPALTEFVGTTSSAREYMAKLYYYVGFVRLPVNPEETKLLWTLARNAAPGWGHFHVELASLYYHTLNNEQKARSILTECQTISFPKEQCRLVSWPLPAPGSLYDPVRVIPLVQ